MPAFSPVWLLRQSKGPYFYVSLFFALIGVIGFFCGAYSSELFYNDESVGYYTDCNGYDCLSQPSKATGRFFGIIGTFLLPLVFIALGLSLYFNYSSKIYYRVIKAMMVMSLFSFMLLVGFAGLPANSYYGKYLSVGGIMAIVAGLSWLVSAILLYFYVRKSVVVKEQEEPTTTPDDKAAPDDIGLTK